MVSPAVASASLTGDRSLASHIEETTERYFSRRCEQLASARGGVYSANRHFNCPFPADATSARAEENDRNQMQKLPGVGPEVFPSPFQEEIAKESAIAKEFVKFFSQAEDEIESLKGKDLDELHAVILAQGRHIEQLQEQLHQQHQQLRKQEVELQQKAAAAAEASSLIEKQREQLKELMARAAAAGAHNEKQADLLQQQRARTAELEEQLEKSLANAKETATLRRKETEQLHQLRRQQNTLARRIRAEKSGEIEAQETAVAARHAAELRKITSQRDALAAAIKKQFKLIGVLKRQKAHLEAARWLQFTEEEFLRVIGAQGIGKHHQQRQVAAQPQHQSEQQQPQQQEPQQQQPMQQQPQQQQPMQQQPQQQQPMQQQPQQLHLE